VEEINTKNLKMSRHINEVEQNVLNEYFSECKTLTEISQNQSISAGKARSIIQKKLYLIKIENHDSEIVLAKKILYSTHL